MSVFRLTTHLAALAGDLALNDPPKQIPMHPGGEVDGWRPKNDSMFVMPLIEAGFSKGGLVLTEESQQKLYRGVILAIGAGLWDDEQKRLYPVEANVGDLVCFGKYSGESHRVGGNVDVFVMKNIEIKAYRRVYPALTEHHVLVGTERERFVYHEAGLRCEHCPEEPTSEVVEEERRKLVETMNAGLSDTPTAVAEAPSW